MRIRDGVRAAPVLGVAVLAFAILFVTAGASSTMAEEQTLCNGEPATIVVDDAHPDAQGTEGDDVVLISLDGVDFAAGEGDDRICARDAASRVDAGPGNDWVDGGGYFRDGEVHEAHVLGGTGEDMLNAYTGTIDAGPGRDTFDQGSSSVAGLSVDLGDGADTAMVHSAVATTIDGGSGRDSLLRLTPRDGVDETRLDVTFFGGKGDDVVSFADFAMGYEEQPRWEVDLSTRRHRATAWGELRFHSITDFYGNPGPSRMRGADREDRFWGLGGDDLLVGRDGNDLLVGGEGSDRAEGGDGRDTCRAEERVSCERR